MCKDGVRVLVICFFKQKTAYEMRISDWSSDACSSDLPGRIDLGLGRAPGSDRMTSRALRRSLSTDPDEFPRDVVELIDYFSTEPQQPVRAVQIGRAACRARVCQYV